jgi:3-oxoacyl-[acyl-carrier protein] reductase
MTEPSARPEGCALVTGASRGIGAAIAKSLARDGWPVAVNYRTGAEAADAVVAEIEAAGGRAVALGADVTDPGAAEELLAGAQAHFSAPVLALVNNAGITADDLISMLDDEQWQRVLDTNLTGAFRLTRRALKSMLRARFGRIINIASISGLRANPGQANYAAAKAGLIAMTKTVTVEVARRGITANAVAPGWIDTEMTEGVESELISHIPARRPGTPEEVAACVSFLASDGAAYVNGAVLSVDGGLAA